jgi:hypothetical protein
MKKIPHFESIGIVFKGETQWDHAHIACYNEKIKVFDSSLSR